MKKLMFATALVASAAAFADPTAINAIGFNGYDLGAQFVTGQAEKDESGNDKAAENGYFCFEGDSDSSVVTNTTPSTTKHTAFFASAEDTKYLALDTEGGTLWRSIETLNKYPVDTDFVYSNGNARAVANTGTYLDTLVQFTVTEDEEPEVGADDKLAIWLQAGEGTTNLMVKAAVVDDLGGTTPTTFTLGSVVEPGNWYRLTVKAVADITDAEKIPGFQIYIDGVLATSATPTLTTDYLEVIDTDSHYADLVAGKYFASLVKMNSLALQGAGFKGTGAVDEIVWTDDDLFPAGGSSGVDFTLTWDANVTAVSYALDGGTPTAIDDLTTLTTTFQVPAGTVVTVAATPAAWYTVSGTGDVTVDAATTVALTTALAATPDDAGATGLPSGLSTAAAKAWADAKSLTPAQIAACSYAEAAYLLNTDLTNEPTFAITAIEEVSGGWQITVEAKSGNTEIDLSAINGTLKVKTAATLSALATATAETASFTVDQTGKAVITITGSGKNFIKATVE